MKRSLTSILLVLLFAVTAASSQVPINVGVQILKAEDARRYDATLENLMRSPNAEIRKRAALAAGRIGKEEAIGPLVSLLKKDPSGDVRAMAAFALGEIESIKAAETILGALVAVRAETRVLTSVPSSSRGGTLPNGRVSVRRDISLSESGPQDPTLARLLEAAGKIAAANAEEEKAKQLAAAIVRVLDDELKKQSAPPDVDVIRLGLTAVLRAKPAGAEETVRKFLAYTDPNVVADALNTLARLKAKIANRDARDLLATSPNAVVRANAARVLGAAEDKDAVDLLIKTATSDNDQRVRVAAIRSLATSKNDSVEVALVSRGEQLLGEYRASAFRRPIAQSELLEVFVTLGRLAPKTQLDRVVDLFREFFKRDQGFSTEAYIARIRVAPDRRDQERPVLTNWHQYSTLTQVVGTFATLEATNDRVKQLKGEAPSVLRPLALAFAEAEQKNERENIKAAPDVLRAYAAFKTEDLEAILRTALNNPDVWVRATAAELLAENAPSTAVRLQIENAFKKALTTDKHDNDAQLAMLDAMAKINKAAALDTIYKALDAPDYLVRKKAFDLLDDKELIDKNPYVNSVLTLARQKHRDEVTQYNPKTGTKLGQVLNTDADYHRALSRKNGRTRAVVTTEKGTFTIDLLPEDAPLTVDNFVKLARSGYFNGLEVHRVVPNFVMQDGDPRGDGNGGPGWSIRCEINMVPYERGAVGMALSGKDTGGSQWFVTHSPQPHLDGGYTVFGRVNESGMRVVDEIVRGDKILSIRIVRN